MQIDANSLNDGWPGGGRRRGGCGGLDWVGFWHEVRTEACGKLNALECFRMVDRITRSNSIRNTLCCCFYYLCLWLSFVRLCVLLRLALVVVLVVVVFLLSEVEFVCRAGEGGARRGVARQGGFCGDCCFIKKMVCKVTYSHCGSPSPSPPSVQVCAYCCVYVCVYLFVRLWQCVCGFSVYLFL